MDVMDDETAGAETIAAFKATTGRRAARHHGDRPPAAGSRQHPSADVPLLSAADHHRAGGGSARQLSGRAVFHPAEQRSALPELFRELQISELDTLITDAGRHTESGCAGDRKTGGAGMPSVI